MYTRSELAEALEVTEEKLQEWENAIKETGYDLTEEGFRNDEKKLFIWLKNLEKNNMLNELSIKNSIEKLLENRKYEEEKERLKKEEEEKNEKERKIEKYTIGQLATHLNTTKGQVKKAVEDLIVIGFSQFYKWYPSKIKDKYSQKDLEIINAYLEEVRKEQEKEKDEEKGRMYALLKFQEKHFGIRYIETYDKERYIFPDNKKIRYIGEEIIDIRFSFKKETDFLMRESVQIIILVSFEVRVRNYRFPNIVFPDKTQQVDVRYCYKPILNPDNKIVFDVDKIVYSESYNSYISDFEPLAIKKFEEELLERSLGKELVRKIIELDTIKEGEEDEV